MTLKYRPPEQQASTLPKVSTDSVSETAGPSRSAMMTAAGRGWHLFSHGPRAVLGVTDRAATWVAARSRISEDWLAASGAEQYAILGAGLDSFAWRQGGGVRVFEVDRPATQAWKRAPGGAPHTPARRHRHSLKTFQAMVQQAGEPLVSMLTPDEIVAVLADAGFAVVEDVGPEDVETRYGLPALSIANERIALATKDA